MSSSPCENGASPSIAAKSVAAPNAAALTDSPWFWIEVFGCAALLGLTLIGGKYQQREARLEQRYESRQEIFDRQSQGRLRVDEAASVQTPPESLERPLLVSLRPLFILMIVAIVGARGIRLIHKYRASRLFSAPSS